MNSECVWRVSSSFFALSFSPEETYESSSDGCGSLSAGHFRAYVPGIRNAGFRRCILSHSPSHRTSLSFLSSFPPFISLQFFSAFTLKSERSSFYYIIKTRYLLDIYITAFEITLLCCIEILICNINPSKMEHVGHFIESDELSDQYLTISTKFRNIL